MVETLSGTFNAISGGNVYNVMLHLNAANIFYFVSYIMLFQESIVYKIPPGGSIASSRPNHDWRKINNETSRIPPNKKSICGDSGDSWPVWNRGITTMRFI